MEIYGIKVPNEIIFNMQCGHKMIRFDFEDPEYKNLADELSKIKYSTYIERNIVQATPAERWERRVEHNPWSAETIKRVNDFLPNIIPRSEDSKSPQSAGIIQIDVSNGSHYMWHENFTHAFEAIQEKLLFGHIYDEKTRELVFFERITQLTEIEAAIIRAYVPNILLRIRKFIGCGIKFFIGLDDFFIDDNHGQCKYANIDRSFCEALIPTTGYSMVKSLTKFQRRL